MLSSGWLKLGLGLLGVFFALRRVEARRWASFLLLMAILAFLLSLGTNLKVFGWQPWWWLVEHAPGFAQVRNVLRFAYFVQIAIVIFAAMGLYGLYETCCRRWELRTSRIFINELRAGALGPITFETPEMIAQETASQQATKAKKVERQQMRKETRKANRKAAGGRRKGNHD